MSEELQRVLARLHRPAKSLPSLAGLSEAELGRLATVIDAAGERYDRLIQSSLNRRLPASLRLFFLQRLRRSAS